MNTNFRQIHGLTLCIQKIHTEPRADGSPYWTHPLRCHESLLNFWKQATYECEIAMLFHDTLEDVEDGATIIHQELEKCHRTWPSLDKIKAYKLIKDLTTPHDVPKLQAIAEVESRYREQRVEPEAFLLKALDMMDNTSDLLTFYQKSPEHKEIVNHMKPQRLNKYSGYCDAIESGVLDNADFAEDKIPGLCKALDNVLCSVRRNLQQMEIIINAADVKS